MEEGDPVDRVSISINFIEEIEIDYLTDILEKLEVVERSEQAMKSLLERNKTKT